MEGKGRNRLVFVQLIQQKSIQVSLLGCFFIAHFVFPSENRISFLIPHAFRFAVISRTAVKLPSIKPFRDRILKKFKEGLPVYSDLSGKSILDKGDFHVDHYNLTFEELVDNWMKIKGMEYLYQRINMNEQMSTITKFVDENLVEEFVLYHDQHTHLRVVTKEENLSLLKK